MHSCVHVTKTKKNGNLQIISVVLNLFQTWFYISHTDVDWLESQTIFCFFLYCKKNDLSSCNCFSVMFIHQGSYYRNHIIVFENRNVLAFLISVPSLTACINVDDVNQLRQIVLFGGHNEHICIIDNESRFYINHDFKTHQEIHKKRI